MKTKRFISILMGLLLIFFTTSLFADTRVERDELQTLISGKTLEGKWIMWKTTYKMYLAPSGDFRRTFGSGSKEEGQWWINKKGKLCFQIENKACRRVKKRSDGGYNLYNKQKELKQTIEKISEGNVYKL